jgi:hypothetical protein
MKTKILLLDDSADSEKIRKLFMEKGVPFDELPAHTVWKDIEWPIPTFFTDEKIYKGTEEVETVPAELFFDSPN